MRRSPAGHQNKALKLEDAVEDNDSPKVRTDVLPDGTDTNEEVEDTAWNGSSEKHPLQNQLILRHFFALCPAPILASCRLVCKSWYQESLGAWRTAVPLKFTASGPDIFLGRGNTTFHNFLDFVNDPVNQCSSKPFRNVRIRPIKDYRGRFNPVNDIFWKAIGSYLTTLELYFYQFGGVDEFRQIIYKWCPNLLNLTIKSSVMMGPSREDQDWLEYEYKAPAYGEQKNLKFLHVELIWFKGGELPVSWIELFSHFPWISSFKFEYDTMTPYPRFEELMEAIRIIRKHDKNMLPFQCFDYSPTFSFSSNPASARNFAFIRELHLPLNKIDIVVNPKMGESLLMDTFKSLHKSVTQISLVKPIGVKLLHQVPTLTLPIFDCKLIRNFPFGIQLDNLRSLRMEIPVCESFAFLKCTPNLLSLHVLDSKKNYHYNKSTTAALSNTEQLANVRMQKMETFSFDFCVSDDDLRSLFNWMPHISDLRMFLNDRQLGMVCQNWKSLKHLEVLGQKLTSEGVTGIREGEEAKEGDDLCPNISNLTNLKTFFYTSTTDSVVRLPPSRWILGSISTVPTSSGSDIL